LRYTGINITLRRVAFPKAPFLLGQNFFYSP
jgi:hypothetical protein